MLSDDSYHTESEFYYPDDLNSLENELISASTSYENIGNVNILKKINTLFEASGKYSVSGRF
jgi:hypothetical protein